MNSEAVVVVDVHGMTKYQAKVLIDSRLKARGLYRLCVIHGYHGGDEIKRMLRAEYGKNHPRVIRLEYGLNQGQTDLVVKEL